MRRRRRGSAPRQRKRSLGARLLRVLACVLLALIAVTVLPVVLLRWVPPPTTSFMIQRKVHAWWTGDAGYRLQYKWDGWEKISAHAAVAVVAAEDQKFPQHSGFDLEAIEDALEEHEEGGRLRGASTITQQVAKNLFLWSGRSFVRKGLEAYFTVLIEFVWPKRRILEVYLNIAELGRGIFGVRAASAEFFGKSASALTREEAALLAAVLPNPLRLNAGRPSAYVLRRRDWILGQMEHLGGTAYLRGM